VKEFLTFLAVKQKVAATTQNQAFNALLFFYRHVLRKEFGKVDGVVRAKRKPYIPVVLWRILFFSVQAEDLYPPVLFSCFLQRQFRLTDVSETNRKGPSQIVCKPFLAGFEAEI